MRIKLPALAVTSVLLLSMFSFAVVLVPNNARATTLFVGGSGPGNYTTISGAIYSASAGGTVYVYNGTYFERVKIKKSITLLGENWDGTIIDGQESGDVIDIIADWVNVSGFTVTNCSTYAGVRIYGVGNVVVRDSKILDNQGDGIRVEYSNNVTVSDNIVGKYGIVSGVGIVARQSQNLTISNNTISSHFYGGLSVVNSEYSLVSGNYGTGNFDFISVGGSHNTISHNTAINNDGYPMTLGGHNNTLTNNVVRGCAFDCIHSSADDSIIVNNTIFPWIPYAGSMSGIHLWNANSNLVNGNIIFDSANTSLSLVSSNSNSIENNTFGNAWYTVDVAIHDSFNNTFVNNSVLDNHYGGLELLDSFGNLMHHNNFINITTEPNDDGNNSWDDGYPSGGNYWDAYNGTDTKSGPDQDQPGSDGIGDIPYNISGGSNRDRYPLMSPAVPLPTLPSAPLNLRATGLANDILLEWEPPPDYGGSFVHTYKVYQEGGLHDEVPSSWSSYLHWGLPHGLTLCYYVSAVNGVGEGPGSNTACATTGIVPEQPLGLTAVGGNEQVILNWTEPSYDGGLPVSNYRIYRGTVSDGEEFLTEVDNVLDYTDLNVANGQTYYYRVSAVNEKGEGLLSNEANATPAWVPGPPRWLAATPGDESVILAWSAPADDGGAPITSYNIFRGNASGGEVHIDTIGNQQNYLDIGLINGRIYYYKVSAVNKMGEGPQSNEAQATPGSVPGPPMNLSAEPMDSKVHLSWSPPEDDGGWWLGDYRLYRGTSPGGEVFLVKVGKVLEYMDTGLTNNVTYYYQVTASNRHGEGPRSDEVRAIPLEWTLPSEPLNLLASPGDGNISLEWDSPSSKGNNTILNYRIYRGNASGEELFHLEVGNVTSFTDTKLVNGQGYYYRISAANKVGDGPLSNEANATPSAVPGAPVLLRAILSGVNSESVTVSWSLSPDDGKGQGTVVGYRVYRGSSYDANGTGYQLLTSLPNGTSDFINSLAGEGDPNNYFYRVCALDLNGRVNCSFNQAGKFTRLLSAGVNLASIPLMQNDRSISEVLKTVKWDRAWAYDSAAQTWRSNERSKLYGGALRTLDYAMAFWIDVNEESNLTVAGTIPSETFIHLHEGWNLVGFPSFNTTYTVADLKVDTGATRIEGFDPSSPPYLLKALQVADVLLAGYGYWICAPTDIVWTVGNI